jgi:sugar phosphate isomerase/epimerase
MNTLQFLAVTAILVTAATSKTGAADIPPEYRINGWAIGAQAYTFNRYTAFEAIEKTDEAGGKIIEFYPGQNFSASRPGVKLDHHLSDADMDLLKAELKKHGIIAVNYGVVGAGSEAEWREIFEFAKKLGLYGITTESVGDLDTIEKLVKEFDIHVGIHEHERRMNDASYKVWDPKYVLSVVQDRDPRIGACADTGHWVTSGLDPLECIKLLKGRVISCHLKDKDKPGRQGHCVPFGEGVGKVKQILDELRADHFQGNISVEYEYNWEDSVPDVKKCIDFVRDYRASNSVSRPSGISRRVRESRRADRD